MNLIQFLRTYGSAELETILRCLDKATFIYFDGKIAFVGNGTYIYYFVKHPDTSKRYVHTIVYRFSDFMKNRLFYSKDITMFRHHCVLANPIETSDGKLYTWKF